MKNTKNSRRIRRKKNTAVRVPEGTGKITNVHSRPSNLRAGTMIQLEVLNSQIDPGEGKTNMENAFFKGRDAEYIVQEAGSACRAEHHHRQGGVRRGVKRREKEANLSPGARREGV